MKKLIIFIFCSLISISLFAEEFNLFSWDTSKDDVIEYFIQNGWSFYYDKDNHNSYNFQPKTTEATFNDEKILKVTLLFDSNKKIKLQSIFLDNNYDIASGLGTILLQAVCDGAKFKDAQYKDNDGLRGISYIAEIDNCNIIYMIIVNKSSDEVFINYNYSPSK